MPRMSRETAILLLGDQLSWSHPALQQADPETTVVILAEVREEASYVRHNRHKIALLFSAMRHFAEALSKRGYQVAYYPYEESLPSLLAACERAQEQWRYERLLICEPGEYRLLEQMRSWSDTLGVPIELLEDTRFLASRQDFSDWASGRKQLRMEYFYRDMRKRYELLMDAGQPQGGKWNYDADNRQPPKAGLNIPPPSHFSPDAITTEVLDLVQTKCADHFGKLEGFDFAVTRDQALRVLNRFITEKLPQFGTYQDAMITDEPWMYHSHIGFYLNVGLLGPGEVITSAQNAYEMGTAPLNSVEGFIRQILGWREFVRGIYWLKMPGYASQNFLAADRPLPDFFWTGDTQMNCLRQSIGQTQKYAYAHHIQRLMVIGNFALLTGLAPKFVNNMFC